MKLTVEIELVKEVDWVDDGSHLYSVPNFNGFTADMAVPSSVVTSVQNILQDAVNSDPSAPWVVNSVVTVDNSPSDL